MTGVQTCALPISALRTPPEAAAPDSAARLTDADARLKALREGRPAVAAKAEELRKSIGTANDPANFEREFAAKERALRIRRFVAAGEVPQALDEYDLLYELTKQDATKEQKAKLEAEWKPRNAAHKKARDFVLDTWRQLPDPASYTANLERLTDASKTFTDNADRLGLRNLLTALDQTYTKLKDSSDRLDRASAADSATLDEIGVLHTTLVKLENEVIATVKKLEETR